jgi:hypothetical protein
MRVQRKRKRNSDVKPISDVTLPNQGDGKYLCNYETAQGSECRIGGRNLRVLLGSLVSTAASCTMVHDSNACPQTDYYSEGSSRPNEILPYQNTTASPSKNVPEHS